MPLAVPPQPAKRPHAGSPGETVLVARETGLLDQAVYDAGRDNAGLDADAEAA